MKTHRIVQRRPLKWGVVSLVAMALSGLMLSAPSPASASTSNSTKAPLTLAATIIDISGGSLTNAAIGLPSTQQQETDWNLVADSIDHSGGAGGHKLVLSFFDVNPADTAAAQQSCLTVAASRPFVVLDVGALTDSGASDCVPAHQVPLLSAELTEAQITKYHPYYLELGDLPDDEIHNGVLGLKQLGWFESSKGFKKLGVLYHDCTPQLYSDEQSALKEAGIQSSHIVAYNLGCPSGSDTPASVEQALLTFKNAGVTDVTEVDVTDFAVFTQVAQQQGYKPQYLMTDTDLADSSSSQSGVVKLDASNFNGAVDVINVAYGEATTPGIKPTAGTTKCDAIYKAAGQPNVYQQADGYGGLVCNYLWFVQAVLQHDPSVTGAGLAKEMHAIGTVQFSYPTAPVDFSAAPAGSAYGVSYWRPVYYRSSCGCFQLQNATYYSPFS